MRQNFYGLPLDVIEKLSHAQSNMEKGPLAIRALCKDLEVTAEPDLNMKEYIAGYIDLIDRNKFKIFYNPSVRIERQRFTVAHLLAHCLLHGWRLPKNSDESIYTENVLFRGGLHTSLEMEANELAADILMPANLIDDYIQEERIFSIQNMAYRFGVSPQLLSVRLAIPLDR